MKHFNTLLSSQLLDKIVLSHDGLIPNRIGNEIKNLKGKNLFLGNLVDGISCSKETIDFLFNFLSDVAIGRLNENNCSVFASQFLDYEK